ncbi:reticulophagy [Mactra antiquata]
MLYVFHVETGTMMTFDMNLAMEKVSSLQNVIAKGCRIPEDKQVLLISGGESLDHSTVVGKYHAGTDTNPIFLFSKSTIESSIPPSPSVNYGSDTDLQDPVEGSLLMPPAYETVVSRAQLALQFQDVDTEELRACEHLILDQHLQQQGWAAVVANLEDVTSELKQRSETFHETYQQYLENRQEYKELISSVSQSLALLSKIPVLPSLMSSRDVVIQDDISAVDDTNSSLYDWIESQDPNHTLHDMVEQCGKSTEQLDEKVDETLCSEVDQLMKEVQNDSMKEVKGLEDRLYGLDQIISGAKKIVQEQAELAQGFVQNQNRLSNLRDRSILPDLCSSHRNQLIEMMKNHSRLREIKKKCRMAKEELSVNLHTRLRWVMYVEKKICDVDGKLTIYLGNLRRLRKRVDILQQVQDAPKVYAQLVIEVVRRKQFSSKYLVWATSLAEDSGQLHEDEVKRRDSFLRLIGHHFLQPMFHGLEDYPPAFATEAPDVFDNNLPEVTADDIKQLRDAVPELSHILSDPAKDEFVIAPRCVPPDSSVKWEDSGELGLKVPHIPRRLPGCKSDSEAIHVDQSPYSIEGGSMSLGDQFEECKLEVDPLVHKPGFDSASPPDTEFLLPKSLSEELTLEMKESEKVVKSPLDAAIEGAKVKENITIASASSISQASKAGPSSRKSLTDTSPDLEGSQEFTTADFYFDESMPSSIESPPKTCSDKSNLEQCVLAEKQLNVKLQQQMKEYAKRLNQSEKTLKMLKQFFDTKLPSLADTAKELKKEHSDHVQNVIQEFEHIRESVKQHVQSYETEIAEKTKNELEKLHLEKQEVKQLLDEQNQKSSELEKSVCELNKEMDEKDKKHQVELDEVKEKFECEMKELQQKHELELEVELDKVKAEFDDKVSDLEREIDNKNKVIDEKESAIKKLEVDIIKIEENLNDKFQTEKEQICDILGVEYDQKLEKEVVKKVEEMKQSVVADLKEKHDKEKNEQLDALKQCLIAEKQEAVEMTQSTLTVEHSKGLEDTKKKLMDERIEELEKLKSELNCKFQEDVAKLSSEFNKEKEGLVKELDLLKNKPTAVIEVQTVSSMFGTCDMESQSDLQPKQTDTQAQTDLSDQQTTSMQTDCYDQSHLGIQTESVLTKSSTNQTETTDTIDSSVQPDSILGVEISVQTDSSNSDQKHCEHSVSDTVNTVTDQSDTNKVKTESIDVEELRKVLVAEHEEKISLLEKKHDEEISQLIAQIEKEKEDAQQLKSSLTSLTGNQQTKFNEAVNRVSREKDSKIEDLKIKEMKMNDEIKGLKEQVEVLRKEKSKVEDVKERALSFLKDKEAVLHQVEAELEIARNKCKQDQDKTVEGAEADIEHTTQSVSDIVSAEEPSLQQKIKELESMVKSKEEEISKMTQKVMELSMSSSTRSLVQDKVSITSCHVGDLVLLCLDERLDQYVVFTVGTTLHFLHTECLSPLGLKSESGEARKQWLIAEVVDKEYCQAKKSNNRFKVPVGTKFYRVKAKKWTREVNPSPSKKSDTASGSPL